MANALQNWSASYIFYPSPTFAIIVPLLCKDMFLYTQGGEMQFADGEG